MITCAFNGRVMTPTQQPNVSQFAQESFGYCNDVIQLSGSTIRPCFNDFLLHFVACRCHTTIISFDMHTKPHMIHLC